MKVRFYGLSSQLHPDPAYLENVNIVETALELLECDLV